MRAHRHFLRQERRKPARKLYDSWAEWPQIDGDEEDDDNESEIFGAVKEQEAK